MTEPQNVYLVVYELVEPDPSWSDLPSLQTFGIGFFSSPSTADEAIDAVKTAPGFNKHDGRFLVREYALNVDHWTQGFSPSLRPAIENRLWEGD